VTPDVGKRAPFELLAATAAPVLFAFVLLGLLAGFLV
jgi:hypothetical protein